MNANGQENPVTGKKQLSKTWGRGTLTVAVALSMLGLAGPDRSDRQPLGSSGNVSDVSITGTVRDAAGSPIARAAVTVFDAQSDESLAPTVLTNDLGQYATSATVATAASGQNVPTEYWVGSVHPNPVSSGAGVIRVQYTTPGNVRIKPEVEVFDVLGRRVHLPAEVAAGLYFYRMRFDNRRVTATRDFVLAAGGRIAIEPEQSFEMRGGDAKTRPSILAKTAGAAGIRVFVEKAGYVTQEAVRQVDNAVQVQVDFSLDAAAAPTASFAVAGVLEEGQVVTFDAAASSGAEGEALSYLWDFGTGAKGTGQKVGYVFGAAGTYPVKLTVTGAFGASATATSDVAVGAGTPPTGTASVSALVYNSAGIPIEAATVQVVGEAAASATDRTGLARVDAPAGVPVTLRIAKSGYAAQSVQLETEGDGSPALVRVTLHPRAQPLVLEDAQNGGTVDGEDGAAVTLPFDALVDDEGDPVDGNVEVSLTSLDVLSDEIEAFPGEFSGVTPDGADTLIVSYGVTEFSLSQNGTELQLAEGKTAEIEIPVYASTPTLGDEIPLWSVDEATGKWIQEGVGTVVESSSSPTGLAMRATVGHFSWYNIDRLGCGRSTRPAMAIAVCRDAETGDAIPCWARVRVSEEGASPGGSVPTSGRAFLLCEGWSTKFKAWGTLPPSVPGSPELYAAGEVDVPPLGVADTAEVIIPLAPFDIGEAIAIAYGDTIYGRVGVAEIDRYAIQGQAGDYVRLGINAAPSGDLDGIFRFIDPNGTLLEEFDFFDRPSYRFETLQLDGEYIGEILTTRNDGPYRLQIARWEQTDDVIALNSRENEFIWPGRTDLWRFTNDRARTIQLRTQSYFSTADSVFSNLAGKVTLTDGSGVQVASADFDRTNTIFNLDIGSGQHRIEVDGRGRFGEYHVDIEEIILENGIRQIAYGDSVVWTFDTRPGGTKQYQFDAVAGDVFRMDVDDTDLRHSVIYDSYLINAAGDTLLAGSRYLASSIPADGRYTLSIDGRFNSGILQRADFAMPFRQVTSPDPVPIAFNSVISGEVWDGKVAVNRYTFQGVAGDSTEVGVTGSFGSMSGLALVFAPDGSFIGSDNFRRGFGTTKSAEIVFDPPLSGEYLMLVASSFRFEDTTSRFSVRVVEHIP